MSCFRDQQSAAGHRGLENKINLIQAFGRLNLPKRKNRSENRYKSTNKITNTLPENLWHFPGSKTQPGCYLRYQPLHCPLLGVIRSGQGGDGDLTDGD